LDTVLTHELLEEGWVREIVRAVQDLRKDAGCEPKDTIHLSIVAHDELQFVVQKFQKELQRTLNATHVEFKKPEHFQAELDTKVGEWPIWFGIKKS
jgi:isoleucyl-tRNA synthetase